jgi:hypothetical protein
MFQGVYFCIEGVVGEKRGDGGAVVGYDKGVGLDAVRGLLNADSVKYFK